MPSLCPVCLCIQQSEELCWCRPLSTSATPFSWRLVRSTRTYPRGRMKATQATTLTVQQVRRRSLEDSLLVRGCSWASTPRCHASQFSLLQAETRGCIGLFRRPLARSTEHFSNKGSLADCSLRMEWSRPGCTSIIAEMAYMSLTKLAPKDSYSVLLFHCTSEVYFENKRNRSWQTAWSHLCWQSVCVSCCLKVHVYATCCIYMFYLHV